MVSLVPASRADAEPDPATASRIPPSIGTVASLTLYFSWFCAAPVCENQTRPMTTARTATDSPGVTVVLGVIVVHLLGCNRLAPSTPPGTTLLWRVADTGPPWRD